MKQPNYIFRYFNYSTKRMMRLYVCKAPKFESIVISRVPMIFAGKNKIGNEIYTGDIVTWDRALVGKSTGIVFDDEVHGLCVVTYSKHYDSKNAGIDGLEPNRPQWNKCNIEGNVFQHLGLIPNGLKSLAETFKQ